MTVDAIKDAIAGLPNEDKIALATWLSLQTMDEWDRKMAQDFAPGGCGAHVIGKVKADIRAGQRRGHTRVHDPAEACPANNH